MADIVAPEQAAPTIPATPESTSDWADVAAWVASQPELATISSNS